MELRYLIDLSRIFAICIFIKSTVTAGESDVFHVEPGAGTKIVDKAVGDHTCTFTYAAQGGTNEQWNLSFEVQGNGDQVICTVERGGTSYIFFEKFSLKVAGPGISIADKEVLSSHRENKHLPNEEYTMDKDTISSVNGKFQNKLEKVAVLSTRSREDL